MADDLLTKDLITYDPLSETTRKERMALLGLSMLGVALVKVPLVPEKLAFLGVEFAKPQQATFVALYALVVVFYLAAFCLYAFTDYVAWRRAEVIALSEYEYQRNHRQSNERVDLDALLTPDARSQPSKRAPRDNPTYRGFAGYWVAHWAARVRAAFEFLLPIAFVIYALCALLRYQ